MRTTLDIDQDFLLAAKAIAEQRGMSMGKVLSDLARQALTAQETLKTRNSVPLFPRQPGGAIVTPELISQLLDEV